MNRRSFLTVGFNGMACMTVPSLLRVPLHWSPAEEESQAVGITSKIRDRTLFAGIRKPIQSREELAPRIESLQAALQGRITGPLTHIFRFDTPVEGYDSEIGFPVDQVVNTGSIRTHTLRSMHFFSNIHEGSVETVPQTRDQLYRYMNQVGLSPELELVEVFHRYDPAHPENQRIETMASYLPWPEKYLEELIRVLGDGRASQVWEGGKAMTPHTPVDERCTWVRESIDRLKAHATPEEQFDVLSRVALVRPPEDIAKYKEIYEEAGGDIQAVFDAQQAHFLETGRTEGRVDPPRFDGKVLHLSKVPYREPEYLEASTPEETRKAYCFCALVREAKDPQIDPIFCYRAAGWARQLLEPIMGVEFKRCEITHSILKGDRFCAWDYHVV
ncbi:MAG: hypothetical protein PVJ76_18960 [Gemmatimonadota bacterium]|jgi:hypothetical protein